MRTLLVLSSILMIYSLADESSIRERRAFDGSARGGLSATDGLSIMVVLTADIAMKAVVLATIIVAMGLVFKKENS